MGAGLGVGLGAGFGAGFAGLAAGARRTIALGVAFAVFFAAVFLAALRGSFFEGICRLHSLAQRSQRESRARCSSMIRGSVSCGSREIQKGPVETVSDCGPDGLRARVCLTRRLKLEQSGNGINALINGSNLSLRSYRRNQGATFKGSRPPEAAPIMGAPPSGAPTNGSSFVGWTCATLLPLSPGWEALNQTDQARPIESP